MSNASRWLVTCSCGWGREASSEWAANAVSRLHRQLADIGTEHVTRLEGPEQHHAGEQLSSD
jgi:hypothetical protein